MDNNKIENNKSIHIPETMKNTMKAPMKTIQIIKPHKKRIITNSDKWTTVENQLEIIQNKVLNNEYNLMLHQIHQKISGYKSQDIIKKIFSIQDFIKIDKVTDLLCECEMKCFYCQKLVYVLYDNVREPRQWTLERIDNKYGHNMDNVVISCLSCNLKRRCIYHERFLFTKQLTIIKNN